MLYHNILKYNMFYSNILTYSAIGLNRFVYFDCIVVIVMYDKRQQLISKLDEK